MYIFVRVFFRLLKVGGYFYNIEEILFILIGYPKNKLKKHIKINFKIIFSLLSLSFFFPNITPQIGFK